MKISKKDALSWFEFFSILPPDQALMTKQQEIVYAVFAQIEASVEAKREKLCKEIKNLKSLSGRSYYVGPDEKFSAGCRSCLIGNGLNAIRKTNKCNLKCPFCYNYGVMDEQPPIGEGMWEIGGTKFYEDDIDLLLDISARPSGVAYVYLEPFMEIEKYYSIIKKFKAHNIHQHLYTNGTLATEQTLAMLAECGLDEIRFNLGATNCSDKVIENMAVAKRYIGKVGIETPMSPDFYSSFMDKKDLILNTNLDYINMAEMHLNENNMENYFEENLYISRQGYISPIFSRDLTLKLMKIADDESWNVVIHDCCNRTKFFRGINLKAKEGGYFGANDYNCEFDIIPYEAFLPVLRDENFEFLTEEELPQEYQPGKLLF